MGKGVGVGVSVGVGVKVGKATPMMGMEDVISGFFWESKNKDAERVPKIISIITKTTQIFMHPS